MSFADRDGVIWLDGELVPWREAKVHVLTHTLHYGMGVFEGVRAYQAGAYGTCIFRLNEHTDRLFRSAHIMNMAMPFTKAELNEAQRLVVRENNLDEAYLRPMAFLGSEGMGLRADNLKVHVMVAAWEWPTYMTPEARELGIKVRTSSYTRHHVNISMCKAKANGHYINSMLALKEALDSGCEEALLLDNEGYVAEGSGENIFLVRDGRIYTPELTSCLDGITRNTVFQLARECGYEIQEKRITRDEVYVAEEAFFTGTAAEVLPIRELDGRVIGAGRRGEVSTKMQSLYFDVVKGRSEAHAGWLSPVSAAENSGR
ncbi:MAG: branched-chain amino acid transaminase [Exilibacterium sp.]